MEHFFHALILSLAVLFQSAASIYALVLIKVTKRRFGWILISAANFIMIIRRVFAFHKFYGTGLCDHFYSELAGLLISMMMFIGICKIRVYFDSLVDAKNKLYASQQELARINKSKDRLFSIISHDLKNPFNTILNFSKLLLKNYDNLSPEKMHDFITRINRCAQHGFSLLRTLLLWSRYQTGTLDIDMQRINLNRIVEENILYLSENAYSKEIEIISKLQIQSLICADENMISTVIRNFLSNAIKFTPQNGSVEIVYRNISTSELEIGVVDSGVGIEKEILTNLLIIQIMISNFLLFFDRFLQIHSYQNVIDA